MESKVNNEKVSIGVIILNYLAYETTIQTVNSFFSQNSDGFELFYVIVDNCSQNESYEELCNEYRGNSNVIVVKTNRNLGFAKGNNFGYEKLCERFSPDFIIVSNDDILLPQPRLFHWIVDSYEKYKFGVLGPDVYSVKGEFHQSPVENVTRNIKTLKKIMLKFQLQIVKCFFLHLIKTSNYSGVPTWENNYFRVFSDKLTLHGSFLIFSNNYFRFYKEPFDPSTFLYMEEDFLKLRCDKQNIKMIYSPSYQINHLQAVSTNMISKTPYKKEITRLKNRKKSLKLFIKKLRRKSY